MAWIVKIGIAWNLDKPQSLVKGHIYFFNRKEFVCFLSEDINKFA